MICSPKSTCGTGGAGGPSSPLPRSLFGAASLQAANAWINLAVFYASHGKMDAAEKAFLESIALREQLRDRANSCLSMALGQLAGFYQSQQRYGEAEASYQRAIGLDEAALGAGCSPWAIST